MSDELDGFLPRGLAYEVRLGPLWHAPACDGCETWAGENRVYQQLQYVTRIGRVSVLHRVRNEQRWKETVVSNVPTGRTTFSDRVGYFVSFTVPVSESRKVPSLVFADEISVQFGREVALNPFDPEPRSSGSSSVGTDRGRDRAHSRQACPEEGARPGGTP